MLRVSKGVAAGIVAGAVLLRGTAQADTTTTTTTKTTTTTSTSTTSTTLLPHPFSKATQACVRQARATFKTCHAGSACPADFQAAFAKCFTAPAGVTCATKCIATESKCLGSAPTVHKTCSKACLLTRTRDVRACRRIADGGDNVWAGGDAACLTTAAANLDLCRFVCAEAALDCRTTFRFCVADCPNL
jgi:hypothetical protein